MSDGGLLLDGMLLGDALACKVPYESGVPQPATTAQIMEDVQAQLCVLRVNHGDVAARDVGGWADLGEVIGMDRFSPATSGPVTTQAYAATWMEHARLMEGMDMKILRGALARVRSAVLDVESGAERSDNWVATSVLPGGVHGTVLRGEARA